MSLTRIILALALVSSVNACSASAQSAEQKADLQRAVATVDTQIAEAKTDDARYASGLVKALVESRIATLEQTKAMLGQRASASVFTIALHYTVDGKAFAPPADAVTQVAGIEAELTTLRAKIAAQQIDVARYSGGLVQAMGLSTLATMRQTEAMLEQKRLAFQYGLPQYVGFLGPQNAANSATPQLPSRTGNVERARKELDTLFEIVSIDARVTESNDTWWKFAWKLALRNKSDQAAAFRATIDFSDKDGFVIDSATSDTLTVPANAEQSFSGTKLVTTASARNVAKTGAKVNVVGR